MLPSICLVSRLPEQVQHQRQIYPTGDGFLIESGHVQVSLMGAIPTCLDRYRATTPSPILREKAVRILLDIADQCDGVRCDMAMLVTNQIFAQTWGERAGNVPKTEYWQAVIPPIKTSHPDFIFMAEVYWDMEYALQQQGFDYTYDKRLYERLITGNARHRRSSHRWLIQTFGLSKPRQNVHRAAPVAILPPPC
jgi:hypothetical protein